MRYIIALMLVFAAIQPTMADETDETLKRLAAIAVHPGIAQKVQQILLHDEKKFTPSCDKIAGIKPAIISVIEEPSFMADGAPATGHWLVRYEADVCGESRLRSVQFMADKTGLEMSSMLPGNTQADPRLQIDVTKSFKLAIKRANPTCENPFVADTRLLSMPKNGDAPWEELWVADVCGKVFGQAIRFLPQEDGTAFALDIPTTPATEERN